MLQETNRKGIISGESLKTNQKQLENASLVGKKNQNRMLPRKTLIIVIVWYFDS